jgi:hypothetical protein
MQADGFPSPPTIFEVIGYIPIERSEDAVHHANRQSTIEVTNKDVNQTLEQRPKHALNPSQRSSRHETDSTTRDDDDNYSKDEPWILTASV